MTRSSTFAAALLAGLALTTAAWAQFGTGQPNPPSAGPMDADPRNTTLGNGRPTTTARRLPFAVGTVSAVDGAAGTLTLAPMFGSSPQTVRVTSAAQITALTAVKVEDLKVGDSVQVQGVPTGITASQITAGDSPERTLGLPAATDHLGASPGPLRLGGAQAAFAQASGKITALSPLTVAVSDSVSVTLKVALDAKLRRNAAVKLADIKVGDRIMAGGQPGDDGALVADRIRVNADGGFSRP